MGKKFNYKDVFSLKNKKIVILGGSGKMGINFSKILSSAGAKIILGDIKKQLINKIQYSYCDVSSETSMKSFLKKHLNKKKNTYSNI